MHRKKLAEAHDHLMHVSGIHWQIDRQIDQCLPKIKAAASAPEMQVSNHMIHVWELPVAQSRILQ